MNVRQGPYVGEVEKDGSYRIYREATRELVGAGLASTPHSALDEAEGLISEMCRENRKLHLVRSK